MADELITCSACGTKNVSHRTVCLSCGGELLALKDRSEIPTRSVMKRAASVVKRINTPGGWSAGALLVVGAYFGFTWFLFGSSHPCGILEARQKPYVVSRYTEDAMALLSMVTGQEQKVSDRSLRVLKEATTGGELAKQEAALASLEASTKRIAEMTLYVLDAPKKAFHDLHEKIWNHYTPAGCFWEALAWNPNPYKGSPPVKDILKGGE